MSTALEGDSTTLGSTFMKDFCGTELPKLLAGAGVHEAGAAMVARDITDRARAVAALPADYFDVLVTPFMEEVTEHRPLSAPAWLRAAVVVVVRNSALEDFHALGGSLGGRDIAKITEAATGPLRELLETPPQAVANNPLAGLDRRYPRAWACMKALSDLMDSDQSEATYESPSAGVPPLPGPDERVQAKESRSIKGANGSKTVVASAVDPRFDQALIGMMTQIQARMAEVVPLSALSRLSRNSEKQFRVLDFLLAHKATVLTTNYLLGPDRVAVRRRPLVKPDSYNPSLGWRKERGLARAHRDLAREMRKLF